MPHYDNSDPRKENSMEEVIGVVETTEGPIDVLWDADMGFVGLSTPLGTMMLNVTEATQLETLLEKVRLMTS